MAQTEPVVADVEEKRAMAPVQPAEKLEIAEVVTRVFHAMDARDWEMIRGLHADRVRADYSDDPSMPMDEPVTVPVEDVVSGLRDFLPGFDATHHLLGPIVVESVDEEAATARFNGRATHYLSEGTGGSVWVANARYELDLERQTGGWRVATFRVEVLHEEGGRDVLEKARRRAGDAA